MSKKHREPRQRTETLSSLLLPIYQGNLEENLGSRLRELRRQQGLSLRALAEKSDLSANTLSLIENGKTSPSVSTLQQIALALNIQITDFFEGRALREPVIYTQKATRANTPFAHGLIEEMGQGVESGDIQPFLVTFEPETSNGVQPLTHDGMEFIYCLSGKIIYTVAGQEYPMEPGDSLVFSSASPHGWQNPTSERAQFIIVLSSLEDHKTPPTRSPRHVLPAL